MLNINIKDSQLCDKIQCKSDGICAVRPTVTGGTNYQSKCLCRAGFYGEFCEKESKNKENYSIELFFVV